MMKKMLSTLVAVAVVALATVAPAASVEPKNVAADAAWLIHANLDAARDSKVVQAWHAEFKKDWPEACEHVKKALDKAGLHWKDLHGVTVYGKKFLPHSGVVLIAADWNEKVLKEKAEKARHHETMDYGKHKICTWEEYKYGHRRPMAASLYKSNLLVLGPSADLVKAALDVLDGKADNLSGKSTALAGKVRDGTIFLARADGINKAEVAKLCGFLGSIEGFDYQKGEHDAKWFGHLTVATTSSGVAEDLRKVFDGLLAGVSLRFANEPKFGELLHTVHTSVEGKVLTVNFHAPAEQVASMLPTVVKPIVAHLKWHAKMMHGRHGMQRHGWHHHGCCHGGCCHGCCHGGCCHHDSHKHGDHDKCDHGSCKRDHGDHGKSDHGESKPDHGGK